MRGTWKPVTVSDAQIAFPADALERMPTREELASLPTLDDGGRAYWGPLFNRLFFDGVKGGRLDLVPRDGIDAASAWRHLNSIMGSFAPKHEHKFAAFCFLASEWFEGWSIEEGEPSGSGAEGSQA